ncbi:MAG: hypothetical protein ACRYG7_14820 [Janthinobacterium lividum]
MKYVLLLLSLLLASSPAGAQAIPSKTSVAAPVAPDTVAALHRLFAYKRKKLLPIVAGTVAADAVVLGVVSATVPSEGWIDSRAIGQALTVMLGGVVVVAEVLFYRAYSPKKEQRAIADFEAHRLPRSIRRQLKGRYFEDLPAAATTHR